MPESSASQTQNAPMPSIFFALFAVTALYALWLHFAPRDRGNGRIAAAVTDYCVFCRSHSHHGLDVALNLFHTSALLELGMESSDGTGATLAWPLLRAAASLLTEVAEHLGLLIELRTGSAVWNHPELERVLLHLLKQRHAQARLIGRAIARTKRLARTKNAHLMGFLPPEDKAQLETEVKAHWREINRLRRVRRRLRTSFDDQLEDLRSQAELVTTQPMESVRAMFVNKGMDDTMRIRYLPHSDLETGAQAFETGIATTEAMTVSQANAIIEHHRVTEVDTMPAHRVSELHRVKRATTAVIGFDLDQRRPVTKPIAALPQPVLSARNASPTLKARLRTMIREELESGTLEQEVSDTFAIALEQALRGALRAGE